jgi:hypothetical protein
VRRLAGSVEAGVALRARLSVADTRRLGNRPADLERLCIAAWVEKALSLEGSLQASSCPWKTAKDFDLTTFAQCNQ